MHILSSFDEDSDMPDGKDSDDNDCESLHQQEFETNWRAAVSVLC